MTAAATVQREAVAAAAVIAVGVARRLILLRLRLLRLTAGNKRRQAIDVLIVRLLWRVLRSRLKMLLLLWLLLLRLMMRLVLLLARIKRLRLTRRERLAGQMRLLVVVAVKPVVAGIAAHVALRLLLIVGLTLAVLLLGGGDQAEIMLGVLVIVFGGNRIA